MHPLTVYLVTFNCARTLVDVDEFAAHFFRPCTGHNALPDLLVLSLQEVAPIANSFLGGSLLTPYLDQLLKAVRAGAPSAAEYEHLVSRNVGMTAIVVLAKPHIAAQVESCEVAGVGVGVSDMGNKGAVAVRLYFGDANPVSFVAAHLTPMEEACAERNRNWKAIVENLVFEPVRPQPSSGAAAEMDSRDAADTDPLLATHRSSSIGSNTLFDPVSTVFFAGDLNYRTRDIRPEPAAHREFPQPSDRQTSVMQQWQQGDQLNRERKAGRTLHQLEESSVDFPPTYKYSQLHSSPHWPKDGSEPEHWDWARHRFPSWCDRILYSSYLKGRKDALDVLSYTALPLLKTSDHRPVALLATLDLSAASDAARGNPQLTKPPFPPSESFSQQRAAARRKEIVVGVFAYLALTWEGRGLILATALGVVGGWLVIRTSLLEE